MLPENKTAAGLYQVLASSRDPFLSVARDCAEITLPFLIPRDGHSNATRYPTPYQSVGARGVTNLAAKLLLSLLPPNTPFFKLAVDTFEMKKIEKDANLKTKLDEALSEIEQSVVVEIETCAARTTAFEALQNLIVAGNGLLEIPDDGNLKFYKLDRYVVQRDPMGNVLTIIVKEQVAPAVLPEGIQKTIGKKERDKVVDLYTVCHLNDKGRWDVWQEVNDALVPESEGAYPQDKCPFIPLRFTKIDGEDYGRGFVEQYLGDLTSLEALSKALVEGSLAAAKILFLVSPNGTTNAKKLAEANNGDFVSGRAEDVVALQLNKQNDLNTAYQQAVNIEKRLETAFLLMTSIQRQAERVTAEEIRSLIQELEASLGGVYSVLAQDFQLPLATALMARMAKSGRLPPLPKKIVRPTVTTGVEALGRGNDLQKLDALLAGIQQVFGPQALATYVNTSEYLTRRATALGVNTKGLIRSDEEVQAQAQQSQQAAVAAELAGKLGPSVIKAGADAMQQSQ